jgi:acyl dehydratase
MSRYDDLMAFEFPELRQTYTERDTMLYALGVGAGQDPVDPLGLRLTYEKDLVAIPSMAVTLAYPGFWYRDLSPGLDFLRTVHGSERFEIFRSLPVAATVVAKPKMAAIYDKGEGHGSLVVSQRDVRDVATGELLARVTQTAFCRGDGGLGGPMMRAPSPQKIPDTSPDLSFGCPTLAQAAMIYRLSGDYNPLHVDPGFAVAAGFDRPILHGLSTYGHICCHLMRLGDPCSNRVVDMDCRFTAPLFPGENFQLQVWQRGHEALFRAHVGDRRIIDNGICRFEHDIAKTGTELMVDLFTVVPDLLERS